MYTIDKRPTVTIGKKSKRFCSDNVIKEEYKTIHYGAKLTPLKSNDALKTYSVRFTSEDGIIMELHKKEVLNFYEEQLYCHYFIKIIYFAYNKYICWSMNEENYTAYAECFKILPDFHTLLDIVFSKEKLDGKKYILKGLKNILEYYRRTR